MEKDTTVVGGCLAICDIKSWFSRYWHYYFTYRKFWNTLSQENKFLMNPIVLHKSHSLPSEKFSKIHISFARKENTLTNLCTDFAAPTNTFCIKSSLAAFWRLKLDVSIWIKVWILQFYLSTYFLWIFTWSTGESPDKLKSGKWDF